MVDLSAGDGRFLDRARKRGRVDEAAGAVEGGQDRLGRVAPAEARDELRPGPVCGKVHAAEKRVAAPCARELVGPLRRNEKDLPQSRGDVFPRELLFPGEVRGLVLRVVLQEREEDADLQVRI